MHRRLIPLLPDEAWPPPEEMLSRKELAKLLGVQEETVNNWDRAGLMAPRALVSPEGILKGLPRVLWRVGELREWAPRQAGVIFKRPPQPRRRRVEWVQGRGWVDVAPPQVDHAARSAPAKLRRPSSKIPGKHLVMLTRLEGQLNSLPPDEEPWPVEEPQLQPPRREEPEPIPFASNVVTPRLSQRRYW
jgi:hypothetical protein